MNKQNSNLIRVISTGVVVLIILSLILFWGRFYCWAMLIESMPEQFMSLTVRPSGLVPGEPPARQSQPQDRNDYKSPEPNEPNYGFSQIHASREKRIITGSAFGALWDITEQLFPFQDANDKICNLYGGKNVKRIICIDKLNGLITRSDIPEPNNKELTKETEVFAGPNGISEKADLSLGRFIEPIIIEGFDPDRIVLYDKGVRRFYVIDFAGGSVIKGYQLPEGDSREPIAVYGTAGVEKWFNNEAFSIWFSGPEVWNAEKNKWENEKISLTDGVPSDEGYKIINAFFYTPLLDKTGQIYIYNIGQQELMPAGYLPAPISLFTFAPRWLPGEIAKPGNVLAYEILPVYAVRRLLGDADKPAGNLETKYLGMIASCVSREGTAMTVAVFDPNGRIISRYDTMSNNISTAEAIYEAAGDSRMFTTFLFLLENLQPVAFEVASYLCGDRIEAAAGHRALFILPNSFVGMLGRYNGEKFDREVFFPFLIGPSLILAVWLAWRIRKDATLMGLSGTAKKWWLIGTLAFGLPAYITYRLTRPKETLVSCQNCGKMRRPDMETCHHCGSKWEVPELTPPTWRISD